MESIHHTFNLLYGFCKYYDDKISGNIRKPSCIVDYIRIMTIIDSKGKVITSIESVRESIKYPNILVSKYKKYFFHLFDVVILSAYCFYKINKNEKKIMYAFHLGLIQKLLKNLMINIISAIVTNLLVLLSFRLTKNCFSSFCKIVNVVKVVDVNFNKKRM